MALCMSLALAPLHLSGGSGSCLHGLFFHSTSVPTVVGSRSYVGFEMS